MIKGLQVGFGEPVGAAVMTDLYALGVRMARLDMQPVTDRVLFEAITHEALVAGLRPLLIIRPEQAAWLPDAPMFDLEVLNEPDIRQPPILPETYAAQVNAVYACSGHHRIWCGSLSNLIPKRLAWLARVLALVPPDVCVTVHRYPRKTYGPDAPQEGFGTRDAEMAALRRVVGARPWGCSEFGYHTASETSGHWWWKRRRQWTDTQVAAFARVDWLRWNAAGAQFACWYQVNDGPVDPYCYGIRAFDGRWKPVSETFREAV
jgi:hypothetical protein